MTDMILIGLAGVALIAAAVQSATGLGFSLLLAPALLTAMEPAQGVQVLIALNLVIAAPMSWRLRREASAPLLGVLAGGAVLGFPLGLWLFLAVDSRILMISVATVILASVAVMATTKGNGGDKPATPPVLPSLFAGGVAGALTVGLGLPGPALALFTRWAGLRRDRARATILSLYLLMYAAAATLQVLIVGLGLAVARTSLILLPAVVAGVFLGDRFSHRLSEARFPTVLLLLVLASGLYLLIGGFL